MDFSVSPEKQQALQERMAKAGILERDIDERFIRAQGHGGQNVNKVSTAVHIKHIPSGIEVKCQVSRSQVFNRFIARRILVEKMEERIHGERSAARMRIEKIRRQKRKRSRRAKEKMLQNKHHHSAKKEMRRSWGGD
ncbi:MAG: peptide chain release factor-like protein [Spirochaetota bacterium]